MDLQNNDKESVNLWTTLDENHLKQKQDENKTSSEERTAVPPDPQNDDVHSIRDTFCLALNILGCFFYMMNYYIVHSSSVQFVNSLGLSDAMSGLIIGAMPWAAMFSSFVFSFWSNTCYRAPLLTSGAFLTAGNVLYASAYRSQSFGMALMGRFLTGLGGPKSLNRRYIADTTPLAKRTVVNAFFGVATAMGSALGPAIAIALDEADFQFELPIYGNVILNGMTGPGYVMGILWLLYTIILAISFAEPDRVGLDEQRAKELAQLKSNDCADDDIENLANFASDSSNLETNYYNENINDEVQITEHEKCLGKMHHVRADITPAVQICMFLLFSKMFTVESVISAAPMITKNRYGWSVQKIGALGTIVGCVTIPISMFIGYISRYREDRLIMLGLMTIAAFGMGFLIDVTDFIGSPTDTYNEDKVLAVGPWRYTLGYSLVVCSVQAFDGVAGSVLSKVIPTSLASGTLNSGLLATTVGTFGRACGDAFITIVGLVDLRHVLNMLFVPSFLILALDLALIWWNYGILYA
mmetsp:Transcript_15380/g.31200  ORF Transcript_15380/g.31200 Transcript_15380/m.31200 type:complete len:526 (-) Transcript_15380:94-1671(-)